MIEFYGLVDSFALPTSSLFARKLRLVAPAFFARLSRLYVVIAAFAVVDCRLGRGYSGVSKHRGSDFSGGCLLGVP